MIKLKMRDVNLIIRPTRGIRNNNPGNIRHSCSKWLGLCLVQSDKYFCQFEKMEYGVRALLIVLRTYYNKHNCNTIRKVISRFAPSSENKTDEYIKFVCDYFVYSPDFKLSLHTCLSLSLAIMVYESNYRITSTELDMIIDKYNLCKSDLL